MLERCPFIGDPPRPVGGIYDEGKVGPCRVEESIQLIQGTAIAEGGQQIHDRRYPVIILEGTA